MGHERPRRPSVLRGRSLVPAESFADISTQAHGSSISANGGAERRQPAIMPATMSEQPALQQRVTVAEAATVLGVSKETVRRMVREGRLEADRVETKRGTPAYLVTLPGSAAVLTRPPAFSPMIEPAVGNTVDPTANMLSAFSRSIAPLVAQLVD